MKKPLHYIIQFICIFLGIFICNVSFAENLAFTVQLDTGKITQIHKQKSNIVFGIDAEQGLISSIYIFGNTHEANGFMDRGNHLLLPVTSLSLGKHSNVTVYTDNLSSLEYTKNYASYSRAGIVGAISKINEDNFDYHLNIGNNRQMGIVGYLKQVVGQKVDYQKNYSSNTRSGVTGKLKSIGSTEFEYFTNTWTTKSDLFLGKMNKVDGIDIELYPPYSYKDYQTGKVSAIGEIKFEYYNNTSSNTSAGIAGRFKKLSGRDSRFKLWLKQ